IGAAKATPYVAAVSAGRFVVFDLRFHFAPCRVIAPWRRLRTGHNPVDVWIAAASRSRRRRLAVLGLAAARGLFLLPFLSSPFPCAFLRADFGMICQAISSAKHRR